MWFFTWRRSNFWPSPKNRHNNIFLTFLEPAPGWKMFSCDFFKTTNEEKPGFLWSGIIQFCPFWKSKQKLNLNFFFSYCYLKYCKMRILANLREKKYFWVSMIKKRKLCRTLVQTFRFFGIELKAHYPPCVEQHCSSVELLFLAQLLSKYICR